MSWSTSGSDVPVIVGPPPGLLGYGGLWTAVYKSGVVGANGKPPENLSTFSRVLYGIAKNEMSTLPHLLRVMGIANEEALTNVTGNSHSITLIYHHRRQKQY